MGKLTAETYPDMFEIEKTARTGGGVTPASVLNMLKSNAVWVILLIVVLAALCLMGFLFHKRQKKTEEDNEKN